MFAGVSQVRKRLQNEGLHVSQDCRGLRGEAEEYRQEDRPDEEFKVVKENDHRLDALRYALMSRTYYVHDRTEDLGAPQWQPGQALDLSQYEPVGATAPMGDLS